MSPDSMMSKKQASYSDRSDTCLRGDGCRGRARRWGLRKSALADIRQLFFEIGDIVFVQLYFFLKRLDAVEHALRVAFAA